MGDGEGIVEARQATMAFPPTRVAGRGRGWYRGDCQVHSARSHAADQTPAQLAAEARALGIDFIAVTEHNTAVAHGALAAVAGNDLLVVLGREVITRTGHWVALPEQEVEWRYGVRDDVLDRYLAEWSRGLAAGLHRGRWQPAIGNSDAHLAGQLGRPHTVVLADELSTAGVLAGLRAGRSWLADSMAVEFFVRGHDQRSQRGYRRPCASPRRTGRGPA